MCVLPLPLNETAHKASPGVYLAQGTQKKLGARGGSHFKVNIIHSYNMLHEAR